LFDGSGDYLSTPDSADWDFGTGDFTIDFWVRFNALPAEGSFQVVYNQYVDGNNFFVFDVLKQGGKYYWRCQSYVASANVWMIDREVTLNTDTWYHVAVARAANNLYIFQGGVLMGTAAAISGSVPDLAGSLYIGEYGGGSYWLNGWLDEFRVSKGVARWTSNFTPPTARYDRDFFTVLSLHMDGADASTSFIDSY